MTRGFGAGNPDARPHRRSRFPWVGLTPEFVLAEEIALAAGAWYSRKSWRKSSVYS
jgi:hypothetical protein